jgi:hypothetical protein
MLGSISFAASVNNWGGEQKAHTHPFGPILYFFRKQFLFAFVNLYGRFEIYQNYTTTAVGR